MFNNFFGLFSEKISGNGRIWRALTNLWTLVFMIALTADFFTYGRYGFLMAPFSAIYVAVLGIYVGTKEFERWHENRAGKHPGEIAVIAWTVLVFVLLTTSLFSGARLKLSSEAVAVYIMVLSVFALTQKSKALHRRKKPKKTTKK